MIQLNPSTPGIYAVETADGEIIAALWTGDEWQVWESEFDPPEWGALAWRNTAICAWGHVDIKRPSNARQSPFP